MATPAASPTLSILSLPTSDAASSFDLMSASDDEVILISDMSAVNSRTTGIPNASGNSNISDNDSDEDSSAAVFDESDDDDFVLVPKGADLMDERMRSLIPTPRAAPQLLAQHPDTIASILRPAILSPALFTPRPTLNPTILSLARLSLEETLPKRVLDTIIKHKVGGASKSTSTRASRAKKLLAPTPSVPTTATTTTLTKKQRKKRAKKEKKAAKAAVTANKPSPPVESSEDDSDSDSSEEVESHYQAANGLLNDYLSNPAHSGISPLHILRALIIELGLVKLSSLPSSIKQARILIKSKALINIQDYVSKREQGLQALRSVMFKSKSALRKDVKKRTVPIGWVKERGLGMLLVPVFR